MADWAPAHSSSAPSHWLLCSILLSQRHADLMVQGEQWRACVPTPGFCIIHSCPLCFLIISALVCYLLVHDALITKNSNSNKNPQFPVMFSGQAIVKHYLHGLIQPSL